MVTDYALSPLETYLDRRPSMISGYRIAGKWSVHMDGVAGTGVTFQEAVTELMGRLAASDEEIDERIATLEHLNEPGRNTDAE